MNLCLCFRKSLLIYFRGKIRTLCIFLFVVILPMSISAEKKFTKEQYKFFEEKIRPALVKHCYKCHSVGGKKIGGKLLLDTKKRMDEGGVSGPILDLEYPDKSLLIASIKRTTELEMPPKHPLPNAVINDFVKWVEMGAPYTPEKKTAKKFVRKNAAPSDLWSLKKKIDHEIPETQDRTWPESAIDSFVLAGIEKKGIKYADQASAEALIKRIYIDLIGLLPSSDEVKDFVVKYEKNSGKAVEDLSGRLLNSPQFGVRWGRFWLDIARYGESNGKDSLGRNPTYPHAWRYRDYVVDSFNEDIPFNRFLTEQLAGDLLVEPEEKVPAVASSEYNSDTGADKAFDGISNTKNFWATANNLDVGSWWQLDLGKKTPFIEVTLQFRVFGGKYHFVPKTITFQVSDDAKEWHTVLKKSDQVPASNSKFDNKKFKYELQGEGRYLRLLFEDGTDDKVSNIKVVELAEVEVKGSVIPEKMKPAESSQRDRLLIATGFLAMGSKPAAAMNDNFKMDVVANQIELVGDGLLGLSIACARCHDHKFDPVTDHDYYALAGIFTSSETLWGLAGHETLSAPPTTLHKLYSYPASKAPKGFKEDAGTVDSNTGKPKIAALKLDPNQAYAMGMKDNAKTSDCKLNINGEAKKLGPSIPRGFLSVVKVNKQYPVDKSQSGRLQLAQWITDPSHPLTARVFVNRVWQKLFGDGIVRTPNDFGTYGEKPTHPELLDHLAIYFIQNNWSVKELIRYVVLSKTYRLAQGSKEMIDSDPENIHMAYHKIRRFDAETFRDCVLQTAGQLDLTPGKGSIVAHRDILVENADKIHQAINKRSIYLCYLRDNLPPELRAFDLPDFRTVVSQRPETVKTSQALFLFNSPFAVKQAARFAELLERSAKTPEAKIYIAYSRAFQREPAPEEVNEAVAFIENLKNQKHSESQCWTALCQVILSSSEFRHTK